MAGRSLGARLGLATNLLLVTGLALGLDLPPLPPPGEPEQGRTTVLRCRKCNSKVKLRKMRSGKVLSCPIDGVIKEEDVYREGELRVDPPPPRS